MAKKSLARTTISIGANIAGLQRGLKTAGASIKRFGGQAKRIGTTFTAAFSAPIAAIGVSAVRTFATFEAEMSKVKAVSGASAAEFAKLESEAKRLGSTTTFTASQVAGLQVEFAKLGFTASEITKVTESTLFLAQAAGTDLARAAEVAGATLRGFGMDVSETGHLTDVMAQSFSESALDMESFAEAMKYVAPVANAAGISLEETTGMLELLAGAGIKGSQAGTSLRRIISQLGATGGDVAGTIKKLASEGLNLADAKDEVGRSAQSALIVLSNTIDTLPALTEGLKNADGAAKGMADTMMDNAAGSFKELQSASEGARIEIGDAIANNKIFQDVIDKLTGSLGKITKYIRSMSDAEVYNKTILAGLIAIVPILITAVGTLTIAFGSLTAAMGPLSIALIGVSIAYNLIKKSISETDKVIKEALANENTKESTKLLQEQLKVVEQQLEATKAWAKEQPKNVNYQRQLIRLEDEKLKLKNTLSNLEAQDAAKRAIWQQDRLEYDKEQLENLKKINAAHSETVVTLGEVSKAYQNVSLKSSDALHRLGEKFVEIQRKAESFHSTANEGMKQAIDLTGGLAFEFSTNLGNAIAGAIINGDSFRESFVTSLKAMAAQLVATIALVAILATLLVIATGGLSGLSFGSVLTGMKAVSKGAGIAVPFLAEGGIVTGPTLAMIGEGSESEAVIPLSKLDNMTGSNNGAVTVYGKISGQDILLSSEKASRTRSRYRGF
tara:strand:+ start:677 stop:2863 length:2187 start_codon:yes stop_codon:yes gene_type:complete